MKFATQISPLLNYLNKNQNLMDHFLIDSIIRDSKNINSRFSLGQIQYSGDLNIGLAWYSNGQKQSDTQMVCYAIGDLNIGLF